MLFSIGNIVAVVILDMIGLGVNLWFLYTTKTRTPQMNAIDFLQVFKTVLCLISLLLCVWLEFMTCSSKVCVGLKALADDIFFFSTCLTFLAIGYVRYKASECRGQASVLVTDRYATKTLLVCFIPLGMFSSAIICLMTYDDGSVKDMVDLVNSTDTFQTLLVPENGRIVYEICHLAVFVLVPISISAVLYFKICHSVIQAARAMEGSMTSRRNDPSKVITMSVTILLSVMIAVWGTYVVVLITSLYVQVSGIFFLYWKLVVLIAHPFGEGVLQKSNRKTKTTVDVFLHGRTTRPVDTAAIIDRVADFSTANLSMAGEIPPFTEERRIPRKISTATLGEASVSEQALFKSKRQSIFLPRTSVLIKNASVIGLEFQSQKNKADIHRQRKISREGLKYELLNIENVALNRQRARRLSNCLRFTSASEPADDEIYLLYRELYDRRGSKFSEKSKRSTAAAPANQELKAIGHVNVFDTLSDPDSGAESPSQRRWRRLYTKAKTARTFSDLKKTGTPPVIQEDMNESKQSCDENRFTFESVENVSQPIACNEYLRPKSTNGHLKPNPDRKTTKSDKKRSVSCVSNVWMNSMVNQLRREPSISFISNEQMATPSTVNSEHGTSRSVSYDSKIQVNCNYGNMTPKSRHSHDSDRNGKSTEDDPKIEHWLLDKKTTREECIKKLMEMKNYF